MPGVKLRAWSGAQLKQPRLIGCVRIDVIRGAVPQERIQDIQRARMI